MQSLKRIILDRNIVQYLEDWIPKRKKKLLEERKENVKGELKVEDVKQETEEDVNLSISSLPSLKLDEINPTTLNMTVPTTNLVQKFLLKRKKEEEELYPSKKARYNSYEDSDEISDILSDLEGNSTELDLNKELKEENVREEKKKIHKKRKHKKSKRKRRAKITKPREEPENFFEEEYQLVPYPVEVY